jgi:rhodanese-related sulfurtransferase
LTIIGLTGYAQHGKDTVAAVLVHEYGFQRVAFADALKELTLKVNPYVGQDEEDKAVRLSQVLQDLGPERAKTELAEVRRLYQEVGTRARQVLGEDVWVAAAALKMKQDNVVISDVRFPNEAAWVHNEGGEVWLVSRPGFDNGIGLWHASEQHIQYLPTSRTLLNDQGVEELRELARQTVVHALDPSAISITTPFWEDPALD